MLAAKLAGWQGAGYFVTRMRHQIVVREEAVDRSNTSRDEALDRSSARGEMTPRHRAAALHRLAAERARASRLTPLRRPDRHANLRGGATSSGWPTRQRRAGGSRARCGTSYPRYSRDTSR